MKALDRTQMRGIVRDDPTIDLIIVVHADGGTDFFSHRPDVEQCERWRVIAVCRRIADTLEAMPRKVRSDRGRTHGCPGARTGTSACPS
jgi:hypothetical protein